MQLQLTTHLVDLSAIVGMMASWGVVPNALQLLRNLFLDALLAKAPQATRQAVYSVLLFVLSFAAILALAAFVLGQTVDQDLVISAILAAAGGGIGAHLTYNHVQKKKASDPAGAGLVSSPVASVSPDGGVL